MIKYILNKKRLEKNHKIGPKDFPFMVKKIGKWIGSAKRYFSDFQKEIADIESSVDNEISIENKFENKTKDKKDE